MEAARVYLTPAQPAMVTVGDTASDSDSDLEELQGDIAKFDETVREFLSSHGARDRPTDSTGRGYRVRGPRGPRKAAKPRGDITARLAKVNQAFLGGDYATALDLVFEVIRINAETHQAWTALSSIFQEQGEIARALSAMVYAAHLRPKDLSGWLGCASFALETIQDDETSNLQTARLCYSAALRADPTNIEARLGKAAVCHRQGHLAAAISEYNHVLKQHPQDLNTVRKLAEACIDNKNVNSTVSSAIGAYRRYFDSLIKAKPWYTLDAPWHDVGIYVELFATTGRYRDAIFELKALSRWLVGRGSEQCWEQWHTDDSEWDEDGTRRILVPGFIPGTHDQPCYGAALPPDLRARLAIYRLRLGDESEALRHLTRLVPDQQQTNNFVAEFPYLAFDLAYELSRCCRPDIAIRYFQLLRQASNDPDATLLLQLGRCYLTTGDESLAEECFHSAIDADESNIAARIELANMYEKAREDEEALILAAEAITLSEAQDPISAEGARNFTYSPPLKNGSTRSQVPPANSDPKLIGSQTVSNNSILPRRYRAKRLANPDKRRQDEQTRAIKLSRQYEIVHGLKEQIKEGRSDLIPIWMTSSKELVDDFRSLKRFYTWDKYLHFIGRKSSRVNQTLSQPDSELSEMYERLSRSLAPQGDAPYNQQPTQNVDMHQGITFDNWLELFLDYAIGLAIAHYRDEAYQVCESARDSTVFQSPERSYIIHVAWSVCAIYTNDEEKCVSIARHLMKDDGTSDSYRMFALLSKLCQSPVSWYTSGPAQKYILRQIKSIDAGHVNAGQGKMNGSDYDPKTASNSVFDVDVCLLMLYGHILFTSTSYTYALGYFLRAHSLDPGNAMINLSLGLAYIHYGLKRQSTNRQYLLLQGQAFIMRYTEVGLEDSAKHMAERFYNVGRLFQLLGIGYLSSEYYSKALEHNTTDNNGYNLRSIIIVNTIIAHLSVKSKNKALLLLKENIKF